MSALAQVASAIHDYHERYRHPSLPVPVVSGLYSLRPTEYPGANDSLCWPAPWPNADRPGIYLMFDSESQLLYIGKAAALGHRVGTYFRYASDGSKSCAVFHTSWSKQPYFIVTVALTEKFEPPSLEEYLIRIFNPPDNKTWTTDDQLAI